MSALPATVPAVIIGAGQAGLAAAHELVRRGFTPGTDVLVLDGNDGPGGAWRHRWDSLTLGRAHGIADLPGLPMERPDPTVPASHLVSDYYGRYEEAFGLQVVRPVQVVSVRGTGEDGDTGSDLDLTLLSGGTCTTVRTRLLLNATGTWTHPYVPYVPGIAEFTGRQLHTVDYVRREDFAGQRVLVIGGGLSAVQFLLELNQPGAAADTVWATRRPPNFTSQEFDQRWGYGVEERVRAATLSGRRPDSVVRNTGIPPWPEYLAAVEAGVLVSRGMVARFTDHGAVWGEQSSRARQNASWSPFPAGHTEDVDTIFWNTGFRPALTHLAPLHLHEQNSGGIRMVDEVRVAKDPRILLVGYGSTASTVGANRAGRLAGRAAAEILAG
ncbi:FAD-dependent oxidoreductase [Corynebacterium terpenotabidum]|uniref:Putative dimethylaniline monooxygenase n=1 Tax=Corynebacterium terpenotabidum Y-11 TaxID=1200352 RepID=S4XEC2_9CORY|nr:FAD-dependent oxidoreductase [Corynebacterium terpenotabidum]AGP29940.1 putative dimethylaniline monooxygenase [Corynebacterium terpenotabidum Y-11]